MKHSLLLSLLLFVCLGVFGQSSSVPPQKVTLDQLQTTVDSQQSTITTLQDSIRNLQMKMNDMKDKVNTYQEYVTETRSDLHDSMALWLAVLTIIMTILGIVLGVAAPLYFNYRNEKNMEELLKNSVKKSRKAEKALNKLQPKVKEAEQVVATIEGLRSNVDEAAKKAKAIQYFIQALQESDEKRALALYDNCIAQDPNFAEAFNNRGFLRHKIGYPDAMKEAEDDFTNAIKKFEEEGRGIYAEAYNNRGILYFENNNLKEAENDFNSAISKDYAEAFLNRGLLKYKRGDEQGAKEDFNNAIAKKSNFAEAYYIRGLFNYFWCFDNKFAIKDIINAKSFKNDVIKALLNRNLLSNKMKMLDNCLYGVEYSEDLKKLIHVPNDYVGNFFTPNFVTEIGGWALEGCTSLTSIVIPRSVTKIGRWALSDCTSLTSIEIPLSVTEIELGAFAGCTSLTSIKIPYGVTEIGASTFKDCTSLTSIIIPYGVKKIRGNAFSGCTSLSSIKIPYGVTGISHHAFNECTSLTSIEIPESVIGIGNLAFAHCINLISIEIPKSVTEIRAGTFIGCSKLNRIIVNDNNPNYCSKDGVLYSKDLTTLIAVPGGMDSFKIPHCVTEIRGMAFEKCTRIKSIMIPRRVTKIDSGAFGYCTGLTEIAVKDNNPNYCSKDGVLYSKDLTTLIAVPGGMDSFKIPHCVTEIRGMAFAGCTKLTSIVIPDSVTEIGIGAFAGCTKLTSIVIPDSVTEIGDFAFKGCTSLISIKFPENVTEIGFEAFDGCTSLKEVHFKYKAPVRFSLKFSFLGESKITIYVPKGSGSAYQNSEFYKGFNLEEEKEE